MVKSISKTYTAGQSRLKCPSRHGAFHCRCAVATGAFEFTLTFGVRFADQLQQLNAQRGFATKYLGTGPPGRPPYWIYGTWAGNPIVRLSNRNNRRSSWTSPAVAGFLVRGRLSPGVRKSLMLPVASFKLSMLTMTAVRQFRAVHSPFSQRRFSPPPST